MILSFPKRRAIPYHIMNAIICVGACIHLCPARAADTSDPYITVKNVTTAAPPGPQNSQYSNGNLKVELPLGISINSQPPAGGFPDEGFGVGSTFIPRAESMADGSIVIREAGGHVSRYTASGVSQDFAIGDASTARITSAGVERTYPDKTREIFSQSTSKGLYLTRSLDAKQNETTISYSSGSMIPTQIVSPSGTSTFTSANGLVTQVTNPDKTVVTFSYDGRLLTGVNGPGGTQLVKITRSKSVPELPTSIADTKGERLYQYTMKAPGQPAVLTGVGAPDGETQLFSYSSRGVQVTNSAKSTTDVQVTLSKTGRPIIQQVSKNGTVTFQTSTDDLGRIIKQTDKGAVTTFTYEGSSPLPKTRTGPDGGVVQFTYDAALRPVSIKYPGGSVEESVYTDNKLTERRITNRKGQVVAREIRSYSGDLLTKISTETVSKTTLDQASGVVGQVELPTGSEITCTFSPNGFTESADGFATSVSWQNTDAGVSVTRTAPLDRVTLFSSHSGTTRTATRQTRTTLGGAFADAYLLRSDRVLLDGSPADQITCDTAFDSCKTTAASSGAGNVSETTSCSDKPGTVAPPSSGSSSSSGGGSSSRPSGYCVATKGVITNNSCINGAKPNVSGYYCSCTF